MFNLFIGAPDSLTAKQQIRESSGRFRYYHSLINYISWSAEKNLKNVFIFEVGYIII